VQFIEILEGLLGKTARKEFLPMQPATWKSPLPTCRPWWEPWVSSYQKTYNHNSHPQSNLRCMMSSSSGFRAASGWLQNPAPIHKLNRQAIGLHGRPARKEPQR
jgi:hypothetical protein